MGPLGHHRRCISLAGILLLGLAGGSLDLASAQQPLPPPVPFDPAAPLPAGTVIGPAGPVLPGLPAGPANSVLIPPLDAEVVWCQLINVTDDYFKVAKEQRVIFAQGIPTEGRITTFPQTGATLLEPWRGDSVGFQERLESTLQSIRRLATVRLIPDPAGWRVEVVVQKELENLKRPMHATAGGATFRNDDSLYRYGTPLPVLGQRVGDQPRPVATPTRQPAGFHWAATHCWNAACSTRSWQGLAWLLCRRVCRTTNLLASITQLDRRS
jgi:hypothetical protein